MSNGDKRSVSTDALETLGTIIQPGQGRDAIHLAVEPVQAAIDLYPGQHVGLIDGKAGVVKKPLGIVDPFLNNKVLKGSWFWLSCILARLPHSVTCGHTRTFLRRRLQQSARAARQHLKHGCGISVPMLTAPDTTT